MPHWFDLWGMALSEGPGSECQDEGTALVVPPTWTGAVPADVGVALHSETTVVGVGQAASKSSVRPGDSVRGSRLEPAPHLPGTEPPHARSGAERPGVDWYVCSDRLLTSSEFWECACFALTLVATHPDDRAIYERIAEIGVAAGERWRTLGSAQADAIEAGMDDALTDLLRAADLFLTQSGTCQSRAELDGDYLSRALRAVM